MMGPCEAEGGMANEEHLEILKQGVDVWNRWREENREVRPDLSAADLREANLDGDNAASKEPKVRGTS